MLKSNWLAMLEHKKILINNRNSNEQKYVFEIKTRKLNTGGGGGDSHAVDLNYKHGIVHRYAINLVFNKARIVNYIKLLC